MSSSVYPAGQEGSSSTSDMSSAPQAHLPAGPQEVEATSSEENGIESDSSATSDSSEDSDLAPPSIPALVSLESPLLAPIIICLNATRRCASVFSNDGKDILPELSYDPDWWRRASPPVLPSTNSDDVENAWAQCVALELQRLNAFLDGRMDRKLAATAVIEELLRMKVSRLRERFLHISDIFACLGLLPTVRDALLNSAIVDGEQISLLPVAVSPEFDGSTLQQALDDMFWSQVLEESDSDNPDDIPILDKLGDVVVITCQSWNTHIDEQLWPERYTCEYLPQIQAKRKRRQALKGELSHLQAELKKIATIEGGNVPTSLEIASNAMKAAGVEGAATELDAALEHLQHEIAIRCSRTNVLDKELLEESKETLELDQSKMTPYNLKGLVLFENEEDAATTITLSRSSPTSWIWQTQNRCYAVRLDQVLMAAREADNFLVVYEKDFGPEPEEPVPIAPSIQQFAKADNAAINFVPRQTEHPAEPSYEPVSRESSVDSANPWITE